MSLIPELLKARYRVDLPDVGATGNTTAAVLLNHRSVRNYLPDALEPGTLELLVAAAQSAATASNIQAWSVVAVEDPVRKNRLATLARNQAHIIVAPLLLVWVADVSRLRRIASQLGEVASGLDYLESFLVAVTDATIAAQSAVTAAESLGLGTVYIGAIRDQPEKVAAELKLPPGAFPLFGLVVGRPDPAKPSAIKPRLPQSVVLHREQYSTAGEEAGIATYEPLIHDFHAEQSLPFKDWKTQAIGRVKNAAALGGRARLAESLENLGYTVA
ncbi:MAG: NADPH-dependent oxidoreductase [Opitutaceae bacterium]